MICLQIDSWLHTIKKRGKISYSFIKVTTPIKPNKLFHATRGVTNLFLT